MINLCKMKLFQYSSKALCVFEKATLVFNPSNLNVFPRNA